MAKNNQRQQRQSARSNHPKSRNTSREYTRVNQNSYLQTPGELSHLNPNQVVQLQQHIGNRQTTDLISGRNDKSGQIQRDHHDTASTLSEALGYQPMVERLANMSGALNPLTASILRRTTAMLEARIVRNDGESARTLYRSLHNTFNNFRLSLTRIGDHAPHRFLWSAEETAWRLLIGRIESQINMGIRGAWSDGRDSFFMEMMTALDSRFINQMITPMSGPSIENLPGGSIKQKIPLGTIPSPVAFITVYLNLKISRAGDTSAGGGQTSAGFEIGEDGNISGGNIGAQASGPNGSQIAGEVNQGGPQVSAQSEQADIGGGSTAQTSVQATPDNAQGTIQIQDPNGWTSQLQFGTNGDMTYQIQHSSGSGMSIAGRMDGLTLQAMAPSLAMGNVNVESSVELQVIPAPQLWGRSLTQTASMLSFANAYYGTLFAISLLPASYAAAGLATGGATAGVAAESTAALPSITANFGRMVLAF